MKKKYIEFEVYPSGHTTCEGMNFVGSECETAMKPFEKLLSVFKSKKKVDAYKQSRVNTQTQRGG